MAEKDPALELAARHVMNWPEADANEKLAAEIRALCEADVNDAINTFKYQMDENERYVAFQKGQRQGLEWAIEMEKGPYGTSGSAMRISVLRAELRKLK